MNAVLIDKAAFKTQQYLARVLLVEPLRYISGSSIRICVMSPGLHFSGYRKVTPGRHWVTPLPTTAEGGLASWAHFLAIAGKFDSLSIAASIACKVLRPIAM